MYFPGEEIHHADNSIMIKALLHIWVFAISENEYFQLRIATLLNPSHSLTQSVDHSVTSCHIFNNYHQSN